MTTGNYPLLSGDDDEFPVNSICPMCGKRMGLPYPITTLAGGVIGPGGDGYLQVSRYGAAIGPHESRSEAHLNVAEKINAGQFLFCFCSTQCLRKFLNKIVEDLEELPEE